MVVWGQDGGRICSVHSKVSIGNKIFDLGPF